MHRIHRNSWTNELNQNINNEVRIEGYKVKEEGYKVAKKMDLDFARIGITRVLLRYFFLNFPLIQFSLNTRLFDGHFQIFTIDSSF